MAVVLLSMSGLLVLVSVAADVRLLLATYSRAKSLFSARYFLNKGRI